MTRVLRVSLACSLAAAVLSGAVEPLAAEAGSEPAAGVLPVAAEPAPRAETPPSAERQGQAQALQAIDYGECRKGDEVAARELFVAGVTKLEANDWARGCAEVAASLKQHCSPSALHMVGKCLEHDQQLLSAAHAHEQALKVLAQRRTQGPNAEQLNREITEALSALTSRIPQLLLTVRPESAGLSVTVDGTVLDLGRLREPVRLDPGPHEIIATAPGYITERSSAILAERHTLTLSVELDPLQPDDPKPAQSTFSPRKQLALTSGAVGVVALGAAAYLGSRALSLVRQSESDCDRDEVCGHQGFELRSDAQRAQNWAFAMAALGAAGVGTGVVLWWTDSPPSTETATRSRRPSQAHLGLGVAPGMLRVRGVW